MEDDYDLYYGDLPVTTEPFEETDLTIKEGDNGVKISSDTAAETSTTSIDSPIISSTFSVSESTTTLIKPPPPFQSVPSMPTLHIYHIENYTFGMKDALMEVETSYHDRMSSLSDSFESHGMRRTVEAVLITYENNHPHILLLQLGDSNIVKLPGDTLNFGEDEYSALSAKLNEKLSPNGVHNSWEIEPECVGVWYRPNFDNLVYPYIPAHVLRPKERITLFLVRLPPNQTFAVPRNIKMMAVPLCDLHENSVRYGPIIAGLPHLLSKFNIICS